MNGRLSALASWVLVLVIAAPLAAASTTDLPSLSDLVKSPPPAAAATAAVAPGVAAPAPPAAPTAPSFGARIAAAASAAAAAAIRVASAAADAVASAVTGAFSALSALAGSFLAALAALAATAGTAGLVGLANLAAAAEYAWQVALALGGLALAFAGFAARAWVATPASVTTPVTSLAGSGLLGSALALYSRLAKSDILENEARRGIFDLISKCPGSTPTQLAEQLTLGWGTTIYHLARLEEAGFVSARRAGNAKCYFAVGGTLPPAEQRTFAALRGAG
ncbi:MAG: winged helix-turn-helix transcriptional regulator, partial [Thermoplasmatota archaeon]